MLPAVLKWNESHNNEKQKWIANALGRPNLSASEAVSELISDLGLPKTLEEVGIKESQWEKIAEYALKHPTVQSNPKPIKKKDDVIQILDLAS
jgi:alcohol dehydrogenase class IV